MIGSLRIIFLSDPDVDSLLFLSSEDQRRCDESISKSLFDAPQLDLGPQEASPSGRLPVLELHLDHLHQQVGRLRVLGAAAVCQSPHMRGTCYSNVFDAPFLT